MRGFIRKHPHLLPQILNETIFLPSDSPWNQRFFHIINPKAPYPVLCEKCNCPVKWKTDAAKYMRFCGTKCSSLSKTTQKKRQNTMMRKYGVKNYAETEEYRRKSEISNMAKFGVVHASQSPSFKEKVKNTVKEKYGVESAFHIGMDERYNKNNIQNHYSFVDVEPWVIDILFDAEALYHLHHIERKTLTKISEELNGYDLSCLSRRMKNFGIEIIKFNQSSGEKELAEFISSLGINCVTRDRKIISPYELDIVLPDYKIAIEYCGLFWHGEKFVDSKYHENKTVLCTKAGYRLLTIFEDEWTEKTDIIKNKIKHLLGLIDNKIYARKCSVVKLNTITKRNFFNATHIQGDGPSSINYGLEFNGELVAAIGFIKTNSEYILNRFSTKIAVVGGFSKLLNFVISKFNIARVVTFADLRWSNGRVYECNGFHMAKKIPPDYNYIVDKKRSHKFNWRHSTGLKKLKNYDPNKSETENMHANGYYKIWDCGKIKYVYENEQF